MVRSVIQRNSVSKNKNKIKKREETKSILFLVHFQGVNGKKWKNFMKPAETITQWEKFRRRPVKQVYTREHRVSQELSYVHSWLWD